MDHIFPNLYDYKRYPNTQNCYLDGRYFNLVFENFPGLNDDPLYISTKTSQNEQKIKVNIESILNNNFDEGIFSYLSL